MAVRYFVAALAVASLAAVATDTEAKGFKFRTSASSHGSHSSSSASTMKRTSDDDAAAVRRKDDGQEKLAPLNVKPDRPKDSGVAAADTGPSLRFSRPSASQSSGASAPILVPGQAAASPAEEEARQAAQAQERRRAEELAAMQRKFDEELKAQKAEQSRKQLEALEAERKRMAEEESRRRAAEARAREARRSQLATAPPACVIKPVMSDDDLARCRGR